MTYKVVNPFFAIVTIVLALLGTLQAQDFVSVTTEDQRTYTSSYDLFETDVRHYSANYDTGITYSSSITCEVESDDGYASVWGNFSFNAVNLEGDILPTIGDTVTFKFKEGNESRTFAEHSSYSWYFTVRDREPTTDSRQNTIDDRDLFKDILDELLNYGELLIEVSSEDDDDDKTYDLPIVAYSKPHKSGEFSRAIAQCNHARETKAEYEDFASGETAQNEFFSTESPTTHHAALYKIDVVMRDISLLKQSEKFPEVRRKLLNFLEE